MTWGDLPILNIFSFEKNYLYLGRNFEKLCSRKVDVISCGVLILRNLQKKVAKRYDKTNCYEWEMTLPVWIDTQIKVGISSVENNFPEQEKNKYVNKKKYHSYLKY